MNSFVSTHLIEPYGVMETEGHTLLYVMAPSYAEGSSWEYPICQFRFASVRGNQSGRWNDWKKPKPKPKPSQTKTKHFSPRNAFERNHLAIVMEPFLKHIFCISDE